MDLLRHAPAPTRSTPLPSAADAVTVVDVRTPAEFETAHIRGSYNLPLALLPEHADQIAARLDRRLVLVCRSGTRACEAHQYLAGVGVDRVHVLDGGLTAYTAAVGARDATVVRGRPWDGCWPRCPTTGRARTS